MRQLSMDLTGASLNVAARVKAAMREAIRESGLSREEIVERMASLATRDGLRGGRGTTITLANLDAWVGETKDNQIPVHLLTIFCRVTRNLGVIEALAAPLGATVIGRRDRRLLEVAKIDEESKKLKRRKTQILSEIGELDE